jgi:receptor protein-tyrosine kinase
MDLIERAAANLAKARRDSEPKAQPRFDDSKLVAQAGAPDAIAKVVAETSAVAAEAMPTEARKISRRGTIDFAKLRASGAVSPYGARSRIDEEFRIIKRPLLLRAFAKGQEAIPNGHLIMVTSARPAEGKTFCATSLAMSIVTEPDLSVLLVDADVVRPRIHSLLGLEADRGLMDLIADDSLDFSDVLIRTNVDNLAVLPAGRPHHLATELLASDRMARIVRDMARRYPDRVIIFDSPPTLASSVPGVLALHVGQIAFIVEADRTSESAVNAGLAMISACKNIGLVLNRTKTSNNADRGYGYYYGYANS